MTIENWLPQSVRRSYTRKFGLVALVILVIVASIGFYTATQVSEDVSDQQRQNLLANAELEGDAVKQWVDTQQNTVRTLSKQRALATTDPDQVRAALDDEMEQLPSEVVALHYLDRDDRTIEASTNADLEGSSVTETAIVWPQEASYDELSFDGPETVIQSWVYEDRDGSPSMALISPVPETEYALIMKIRMSERAQRFRSSIDGTRTTIIGRGTGDVLLDRDEDAILAQYGGSNADEIRTAVDNNPNGTLLTSDSVVAYTAVGGDSNWVVIKKAPKSSALVVRQQVEQNIFLLIGSALVGLVVLGLMVRRGPMRSMQELSSQATALADGDLDIEISDDGRIDEVGQVRTAFRDITAYLQTVADQADALSRQDFDAAVLDEPVPGRLGDSLDAMQTDLEQFIDDLETARSEAEVAKQDAEALADSLEQQATAFGAVMARAAEGDLTQRLDTDIDNDAMREIAEASNEMIAELERTVVEIERFARDVDDSSEQISASADEVRTASEQVAETIQEISSGAEQQNENIQQVTDEMTDLSATIEEITSSTDEIATKAERASETGEQGREYGREATEEIEAIEQKATETIEQVETLATEVERIGEVVTLIDEIADQTNMLALNASIEASRAGEAGEGFGVVADEIKELAAQTQAATDDIDSMITEIQSVTDETVVDMREMGARVDTGQETIREATEALDEIVEQVEETNAGIQSISDATTEQAASTEEVVAMVDEVGSISEQTSAQTENVAASAEEQTASITEVTENIRTLSDRASDLKGLVESFETEADATSGHSDSGPASEAATGRSSGGS
ncbi:methyl-accepting chemotaxis protein [Halomicrobium sp. HM KBTZ05]|uniref:methyl-accepting chemotaxis protein n=1 Tax=Halomicrobium sp. HM KBTZ05 TaxID=3242663 RepID=UPI003558D2F6